MRQCENRRAEIEGVALSLEHVEFAAGLRVFLVNGNIVAFLGERDGGGDPTEA